MGVAYGWASDSRSEHWHITGAELGHAIAEATAEEIHSGTVGWLCKAHKLRIDEILDDGMVETWLEHLDEKAGEVAGIQDPLFKSVGNDWHERVRKTRESITGTLQILWKDALWYHEVDEVAPLVIRHDTVCDASLTQLDWVQWRGAWYQFSGLEETSTKDCVMLGLGRAFRQMSRDQKVWAARVGEWSRFGEV